MIAQVKINAATRFFLLFTLLFVASGTCAEAYSTICKDAQWKRYRYGQKAAVRILMPGRGPDTITSAIKAYAAEKHLSYSSVDFSDPEKRPPLRILTHILQDVKVAMSIEVEATNRNSVAKVSIDTFSFSCGPTKDWRPYWKDFLAFVRAKKYPVLPG